MLEENRRLLWDLLQGKLNQPSMLSSPPAQAGPVKAPTKSRSSVAQELSVPDGDENLSETSRELEYSDDSDEHASCSPENDAQITAAGKVPSFDGTTETSRPRRERKRKRNDNEELEVKYLAELTKSDGGKPAGKRTKGENGDSKDEADKDVSIHESLTKYSGAPDLEKAGRTVFLGNVSAEAITSKKAKKTLITYLSSVLDQSEKLESIRFRSVSFSTGSMPKRASYITKSLMSATSHSANAYAVLSSPAAARRVAFELNGSEVLSRHIRVDSVSHPSVMDHRRCIFVGNLGFVDDETVLKTNSEGKTVEKKRHKAPADVEEGLWRTFLKQGKVENVRVVRDAKTRVGKGFAYVQFYDGNDVEAALLLDGEKFPPMLPRPLRVTRAKNPRKKALAQERSKAKAIGSGEAARRTKYERKSTAEEQAAAGRAAKLLGRTGAAKQRTRARAGTGPGSVNKSPEQIVFEGRRASAKDGRPKDLKLNKKSGKNGRPTNRGARRAAGWRKKVGA